MSCLDKYASQLPVNTAPAGYQCPKCKQCIFPPVNLVSPVVDVLKQKLENLTWSRIGLLPIGDATQTNLNDLVNESLVDGTEPPIYINNDDETNGFVIVNDQIKTESKHEAILPTQMTENSLVTVKKIENEPLVKQKEQTDRIYNEQSQINISHNRGICLKFS